MSAAGGSPVRSNASRRTSVAGSPAAVGLRPAAASGPPRNRSIGCPAGCSGSGGPSSGASAQWSRARGLACSGSTGTIAPSGCGAPASTQAASSATSSSESGPSGGIASCSSTRRTACTSRLVSADPGTSTGPVPPPAASPSRESSLRLASCVSAPWHSWQRAANSGPTRSAKVITVMDGTSGSSASSCGP